MIQERDLWAAVLLRAIYDLAGLEMNARTVSERRQIRERAEWWIESPSFSFGSFRWVCAVLDVDAPTIRRILSEVTPSQLRFRLIATDGRRRRSLANGIQDGVFTREHAQNGSGGKSEIQLRRGSESDCDTRAKMYIALGHPQVVNVYPEPAPWSFNRPIQATPER